MENEESVTLNFSTLRERALSIWYKTRRMLREHGWVLIACMVVFGVGFLIKALIQGPMYISTARLMASGQIALPEKSVFQEERAGYFGTQMNILQSPRVKERALERLSALHPELKPCNVEIKVQLSNEAAILGINAIGSQPEYTQAYLAATLQAYQEFKKQMREQAAESTSLAIQDELLKIQREIDAAEKAKIDFQRANNITFMREQGTGVGTHLVKLKSEQAELSTQYNLLANADIDSLPMGAEKIPGLETAAEYSKLKEELSANELLLGQYQKVMKPTHPKLVAVRDKVARQRLLLTSYREQSKDAIARARESLQTKLQSLNKVISEWETKALEFTQKLSEFETLDGRLTRAQDMYGKLVTSVQTIDVSQRVSNEVLSILEDASPALRIPSFFLKKTALGLIAGAFLGGMILFTIAMFDSRFSSIEDLTAHLHYPVWGVIPLQPQKTPLDRVALLTKEDDRPVFAEAYRNLRSSLNHAKAKNPELKVLLITSSIPSEGKTTVSANLATALAFSGHKVLLVDADLRKGRLHDDFAVSNSTGLSEALVSKPFEIRTLPQGIDYISRGSINDHPAELLESKGFADMVATWRAKYDWILIDTPPILAAEDCALIMPLADRMMYVVRAHFTEANQVSAALRTLDSRGIKPAGLVFNLFDLTHPNYYHYKYSDYYHRSAKTDSTKPASS